MQDRGPAAYLAEFVGTLLLVFFITAVVSLYVAEPTRGQPEPVHRLLGHRAGARVPAVRADPDARGGLGRPLQPGGHRGDDGAAPDQADRRRVSTSWRSSLGGVGRRAAHQGAPARRGQGRELRRRRGLGRDQRQDPPRHGRRGARHVLPALGDHRRGREPARDQGMGRPGDRHGAGHGGDGVRAADRRRLQPGARLRPGAGVGRVGRLRPLPPRLHARPDRGRAGWRCSSTSRSSPSPARRGSAAPSPSASRATRLRRLRADAAGHVFAELHAVAVADVPVLLQVLRVRDAPRPPVRAGRGREAARRRRPARRQGAARADRREAGGERRGGRAPGRVRARRLHLVRRLGLRAGARARDAAAHERRRVLARGAGAPARGDRLAGADAGVGQPGPRRAPGLADQAPGARGSTRSARPASCASRSRAASWSGSASRPRSASRRWRRSPRCIASTATSRR